MLTVAAAEATVIEVQAAANKMVATMMREVVQDLPAASGGDSSVQHDREVEALVHDDDVGTKALQEKLQEVQSGDIDGRRSREQALNIGTIIKGSGPWSHYFKSLKQQIHQAVYGSDGTTADQVENKQKRLSNYSQKALWFAILACVDYMLQQYTSPSSTIVEGTLSLVAVLIFHMALPLLLPTNSGKAFVCVSGLLEERAAFLLVVSYNGYYAFAIPLVLLLILLVALVQQKLQHAVVLRYVLSLYDGGSDTAASGIQQDVDVGGVIDQESRHLDYLYEISQGIANCGSIFTAILGHFMVGPVNAPGFFFYCIVALALYLMMVITVRAVSRTHAFYLSILLAIMFGTAAVAVVRRSSASTAKVAKYSNHRNMLTML